MGTGVEQSLVFAAEKVLQPLKAGLRGVLLEYVH
jgi:hypothetical protein